MNGRLGRALRVLAGIVAAAVITATATPATATSTVGSCGRLNPGDRILSADGHYSTIMQTDGNVVTYVGSRPIWGLGTNGYDGAFLSMQCDGNLVLVAPDGTPIWASGTNDGSGNYLAMQTDGNLVVIAGNGVPKWASGGVNTRLNGGEVLQPGWFSSSPDRRYQLIMQADGNAVVYNQGIANFATGTDYPGSTLEMQGDGNLVVYRPGHVAVWSSNASGHANSALLGQNDGNFVIYAPGNVAVWASVGAPPSGSAAQLANRVLHNGNISISGRCVTDDLNRTAAGQVGTSGKALSAMMLSDLMAIAGSQKVVITAIESCGTGHSSTSNHYAGTAIDLVPGAGNNYDNLVRTIYNNRGSYRIDELIHKPMPSGTTTLKHGQPFTYAAKIMNDHAGHVHYSTS